MDKVTSLFRVFDVAFFAPGAVLFYACHKAKFFTFTSDSVELSKASGLEAVAIGLALIYTCGLICHATQRAVLRGLKKIGKNTSAAVEEKNSGAAWYSHLVPERRQDLATYFWYMRATSWNLAVALPLGMAALEYDSPKASHVVVTLVMSLLLIFLGMDFNRAMVKAAKSVSTENTGK